MRAPEACADGGDGRRRDAGPDVTPHFGWPTSSWLDRMSTGMLVANLMRLPLAYPTFHFDIGFQAAAAPPRASGAQPS